jgi:reactive chlorine resistance protein C
MNTIAVQEKRWLLASLTAASKLDRVAMGMLRVALVIVLVWIGGLKFVDYEAEGIAPLVANSPVMSFLYHRPACFVSGHGFSRAP